jgi:hypothetical protein
VSLWIACGRCESTDLTIVDEKWDDEAQVFVGEQQCGACGCGLVFTRGASEVAKQKVGVAKRSKMQIVKPGGALPEASFAPVPVAEAIASAQESLGEPKTDEGLTADQARQLSECSERVDRARKVYEDKREAAKTAKEALDGARDELERKVKAFTHPEPLPLFDGKQAEADVAKMVEGDGLTIVDDPTTEVPANSVEVAFTESELVARVVDPPEPAAADEVPF